MGSDVEQWRGLVAAYFPGEVDLALCVMAGESGGNPSALNPSGAAGLFQIMPFWWNKYGGDRFDPETNVAMARLIRDAQGWSAWNVYPNC
jgi:soluble lytic murein transglycosylase-like protein